MIEKPTPTEAEQRLIVPGLRAGHYLCFFGMHVLTPAVMELLGEDGKASVTLRLTCWQPDEKAYQIRTATTGWDGVKSPGKALDGTYYKDW